jgi:regulator of PEP synthase PpsR (kinase-PPPase family)
METLIIYVISDSVGETAQQVARAAISQFSINDNYEIRRFPYVVDKKFLMQILNSGKNEDAIILYTLVNEELSNLTKEYCHKQNLSSIDLMSPILDKISNKINKNPKRYATFS